MRNSVNVQSDTNLLIVAWIQSGLVGILLEASMIPAHLKDEGRKPYSANRFISIPLSLNVKIVCILSGLAPTDN